jgi:flagella basal body P-ring formation protein FlgA
MTMRLLGTGIFALLLASTGTAAAGSITVSRNVAVRSSEVHLGDVARLSGFDRETRDRLAGIELGPAPVVGTGRLLPRAFVSAAINEANVPAGTRISVPERLELTRASQILPGDTLSRAVEDKLRGVLPRTMDVAEIRVPLMSDLKVPEGSTYEIKLSGVEGGGPITADIVVKDGDTLVRSQRVAVRVDTVSTLVVADGELGRGQTIGAGEVRVLRVPESRIPDDAIRNVAELEGAQLRRPLKDGEAVTRRSLELMPLVHRGDRVTMIAEGGGIRITAVGEALGSARRGDAVKVRNIDSQKIVSGRVTASQTVAMEL